MSTTTEPTIVRCRYRRQNGEMCTAEVLDPDADILICGKHAARVMVLVRNARAALKASA
jgi:hypothetical protein